MPTKNVIKALEDYNFTFEGNHGFGVVNGYEINVCNAGSAAEYYSVSTFMSPDNKTKFIYLMKNHKIVLKPTQFGFIFRLNNIFNNKKRITETINTLINELISFNAPKNDVDPYNGEVLTSENSKLVFINGIKVTLSYLSIDLINRQIKQNNEDIDKMPNNYFKGWFGLFIGAIVGLVITYLLLLIGFVAAVSSLVAVYLGTFLYIKFGGKPDKNMMIMSFITTTVVLLFGIVALYILSAETICLDNNIDYQGIKALKYVLDYSPEFKRSFIVDLLVNILFIVIGEASSIKYVNERLVKKNNLL